MISVIAGSPVLAGNYLSVVWMGRDDNGKTPLTGGTGALQLWTDVMSELDNRSLVFNQPEGISYHWVETDTGFAGPKGMCRISIFALISMVASLLMLVVAFRNHLKMLLTG